MLRRESFRHGRHHSSLVFVLAAASFILAVPGNAQSGFNTPGNILITDQFNSRVIEIDPAGNIVWQYGGGPDNITATAIIGTNDAERVGALTLMSGIGIPPGVSQATAACFSSGCVDNRVLLVDQAGSIVWQYGQFGVTGFGPNQLNVPVQNTYFTLQNGEAHVFITDQSNERIIEVRLSDKQIVWQYGENGVVGNGPNQLSNPNAAELLNNGHVLISDENNNRAIEVTHVYGHRSEGATMTFPGEVVNWRIFSRSIQYENQLHLIYDDRLEVLSFNQDYFVDQSQKQSGIRHFQPQFGRRPRSHYKGGTENVPE